MNQQQAKALVQELTDLLTGRELIVVSSTPAALYVRRGKFRRAYSTEYGGGRCDVTLVDSYGLMTGSDGWSIETPIGLDFPSVKYETKDSGGEVCRFAWIIIK